MIVWLFSRVKVGFAIELLEIGITDMRATTGLKMQYETNAV